ncbi:hypothetical protein UFOVP1040_51 [uncultured Caudovirales phage]|uniref:Uncharacterized protein n=1 Tax=uncultured Caudovirales phage TaxID=2100421 RepID=A0A6J5Q6U1_9CAUD|nr:hypothetical protein UFOVP1040_51 [uncultured Caudovirales phage]
MRDLTTHAKRVDLATHMRLIESGVVRPRFVEAANRQPKTTVDGRGKNSPYRHPVTVNGQTFASKKAARRALGIGSETLEKILRGEK